MTKAKEEVLALTEKVVDSTIKIGCIGPLLGLDISPSIEETGAIGLILSVGKIASHIRDSQFERSFQKFASELDSLTHQQKLKFYEKHSKKDVNEFGEQALLLLNKIEMPLAANMMGKAHYLLVLGEINEDVYHNYCYIIKNINLYLFKEIKKIFTSSEVLFKSGIANNLYNLALLEEEYVPEFPTGPVFKGYKKSEFGNTFYFNIINPFVD